MNIKFEDDCVNEFQQLKFKKNKRYLIYKIENEKIVIPLHQVIDQKGQKNQTYEQFRNQLPSDDFRYCILDFQFKNNENMNIQKLVFIFWAPDSATAKTKLIYASAKQNFKKALKGIAKDIHASSLLDIQDNEIRGYFQ